MGIFRRRASHQMIPVHPDNAIKKDWVILLEAGTIVGPSPDRLRIARATLERKIIKKRNVLFRAQHFLVVEGYDPRIHSVYFCPQLYKYDTDKKDNDKKLVPLQGDEIGKLIAQALESGVNMRQPWYEPLDKVPAEPIINAPMKQEFDTVVVDMASARNSATAS